MSLAEERDILRQISVIQKSKGQVEEQRIYEEKVQELKVSLKAKICCIPSSPPPHPYGLPSCRSHFRRR